MRYNETVAGFMRSESIKGYKVRYKDTVVGFMRWVIGRYLFCESGL